MNTYTPLAVAYYMNGINFKNSADQLAENMELKDDGTPSNLTAIPYYFLISHAAELFLKSALLKRGVKEQDLKKFHYGHNLNALLEELTNQGLSISQNTVAVINGLQEQHKQHSLRYTNFFEEQKLCFPPVTLISEMLDELFSLTRIATQGK